MIDQTKVRQNLGLRARTKRSVTPWFFCLAAMPAAMSATMPATTSWGAQGANAVTLPYAAAASDPLADAELSRLVQVEPSYLERKLKEFTGVTPVKLGGRELRLGERHSRQGKDLALAYLQQEYKALGYDVQLHNYGGGVNFVAEKKGQQAAGVFVVAAHYDSMATVGADDDASGVIAGLAIAQSLAQENLTYSLRIVAFDQEEQGLYGSRAYVNELTRRGQLGNVLGVLVLEMLGYDSDGDGAFHIIDCASNPRRPVGASGEISRLLEAAIAQAQSPLQRIAACTNRSDHTNFWRVDKPAVVVSQNFFGGDGNPCYHRRCDQVQELDLNYMAHLSSAAASATASVVAPTPR